MKDIHADLIANAAPAPTPFNSDRVEQLKLPWPLSLNRLWRAVGGRVLLSADARACVRAIANALPRGRIPPPLTGRLAVQITLCPPKSESDARWDVANREKLICDALTKQRVWADDSQIDWISLARGPAFASGCALVRIDVYHADVNTNNPTKE